MNFSDYANLQFVRVDRVLKITLNRPDKLNSISGEFHTEVARVFPDVASDPGSDIVVLTGAGRAFSAGGDLAFLEKARSDPRVMYETLREARAIVMGLLDCDKPIICRMNGDAIGLGATLALFCDVIVAADHARIGDPHVRVGLVAGDGGALIWPQLIGYARAKQYLLTGDMVDALTAQQIGLITAAVPEADLDRTVDEWITKLTRNSPLAVRWTKATINTGLKQLAGTILDTGVAYEGMSFRSDDLGESLNAIRDKRKPNFQGR
jgi:enoyl-CoA hydratase